LACRIAAKTASEQDGRDRLADARDVQHAGAGDEVERQVLGPDEARGRARAKIAELVPVRPVRDEVDARPHAVSDDYSRAVDALAVPEFEKAAPERVVTQMREEGRPRPAPRRRDGEVRRVAAMARQIELFALSGDLGELHQRLAEGDEVEIGLRHAQAAPLGSASGRVSPMARTLPGLRMFAGSSARFRVNISSSATGSL
jgi:hypothetical protein